MNVAKTLGAQKVHGTLAHTSKHGTPLARSEKLKGGAFLLVAISIGLVGRFIAWSRAETDDLEVLMVFYQTLILSSVALGAFAFAKLSTQSEKEVPTSRRLAWRNARRVRNILLALGVALFCIGDGPLTSVTPILLSSIGEMLFFWSFFLPVALAGLMHAVGNRLEARSASDVMRSDQRPPIVLLRSFRDDRLAIFPGLRMTWAELLMQLSGGKQNRLERYVADAVCEFGPLVAIGRPGESLPQDGAARDYAGEEWQARVNDLLSRALAIIVIPNTTAGLAWELALLRDRALLGKLLVVIPPRRRDLVERLSGMRQAGFSLPTEGTLRDAIALVFDKSGQIHAVASRKRWGSAYRQSIQEALQRMGINPVPNMVGNLQPCDATVALASTLGGDLRLYSPGQMGWAAFLAFPAAGTLLLSINRRRMGLPWPGTVMVLLTGIIFTVGQYFVPSLVLLPLSTAIALIIWLGVEGWQDRTIKARLACGALPEPAWKAAMLSIACFCTVIAIYVLITGIR